MRIADMPLSWKIGAAAATLVVALFAWNGVSRYLADRHADALLRESAAAAELEAQKEKALAQLRQAQLSANIEQQRQAMLQVHEQVGVQSQRYQAEQAALAEKQRQEGIRVKQTYRLGPNQRCAAGLVFDHAGGSFSALVGKDGRPVKCSGEIAAQPLR